MAKRSFQSQSKAEFGRTPLFEKRLFSELERTCLAFSPSEVSWLETYQMKNSSTRFGNPSKLPTPEPRASHRLAERPLFRSVQMQNIRTQIKGQSSGLKFIEY